MKKGFVIPSMRKCKQMKLKIKEKVNHDKEESKDQSEEDKEKEDHPQKPKKGCVGPRRLRPSATCGNEKDRHYSCELLGSLMGLVA